MSKPKKKPKSENKKPKSKIAKNNSLLNASLPPNKKNVMKKTLPDDGIAKSKQLKQKLQTTKSSSYGRPKIRTCNKDNEIRLCGNGKPMPSLSELETMFEDSDEEEENKVAKPLETAKPPLTPKKNTKPNREEKLMSPTTISLIANRVLDLVSNISDPSELLEDGPRPPIIKPKKRKKPDKPYIVGCKERKQVPQKLSVKFCKGDEKYGPDSSAGEDDDDLPTKRAKRGTKCNISKSIFNAKSDEIAARLKECDGDSNGSSDSNKTVAYEYYTPLNVSGPRSFSPIPSTSKDNDTFVKNDQRFNESIISENLSKTYLEDDIKAIETPCEKTYLEDDIEAIETPCESIKLSKTHMEDDIEVIETPYETIELHDTIAHNNTSKWNGSIIEIEDDGSSRFYDEKLIGSNKTEIMDDNDSLQVVDVKPASPILVEDYYSNLDIENIPIDDVGEVIDVDDIIAENKAIIEKYSKTSNLDTVTLVDTSINTTVQNNKSDVEDNNLEKSVNISEISENHILDTNSNRHSLTNDLSVICVNNDESSVPITVIDTGNNKNVDVEVIDDSNYHSIRSVNVLQNRRAVESVPIDLESALIIESNRSQELGNNNRLRNNETFEPNHRCDCVNQRRDTEQHHNYSRPPMHSSPRNCHHLTGTEHRTLGNSPEFGPSPDNVSYRKQLKILKKFFKKGQTNSQGRKRKPNKQKPMSSENILSPGFTSWLQSLTNNMPIANVDSNRVHQSNHAPSPASITTDSPDKTSKRIGDCPICMDSLSNKPIVSTICGHIFCMDCIKLAIRSNGYKCPTCRKALKRGTGYHQIFL